MSYIENYYKTQETRQDECLKFFNKFKEEDDITKSKKEINRLLRELKDEQNKCTVLMNKRYNSSYEPIDKQNIIKYAGKNDTVYFDAASGLAIEEPSLEDSNVIQVDTKNGEIKVTTGYCFDLGAVVQRKYKYTVLTNNEQIRLSLLKESIIPMLESDTIYSVYNNYNGDTINVTAEQIRLNTGYYYRQETYGLNNTDATYFLNKMYGLEKEEYGGLTLWDVNESSRVCPSFEIIVKNAPSYAIKTLLKLKLPKAGTVAKALSMTEEEYQKTITDETLLDYLDFRKFLDDTSKEALEASQLSKKTTSDWIDYLEKCKAWQEDLDFYSVGYEGSVAKVLVKAYLGRDYYYHCQTIYNEYKFGKFCKYVIDETINQGYNSIRNFCSELHDYINMCHDLDVKPTLYSSYLHQTHDITSRNHKIKLEKDQEEIFKKRYEKFKPYKTEKYSIIAPEKALDVQKEGDQMNNCVASYIKRIIDGSCLILFLRYTESLAHSLVTVEIRDNAIVQAKQSHNNRITTEQQKILEEFAQKRELEVRI